MSRSYRHHPIISITCSGYRRGEKQDKCIWHRQSRSICNRILRHIKSYDESLDIPYFPHKNDVQIYNWLKDGKQRVYIGCRGLHWTKDGFLRK